MRCHDRRFFVATLAALLSGSFLASAPAQDLSGAPLRDALRAGGLVIVMRHASSPRELPDAASADAENSGRERQLDAAGRAAATAMGSAIRTLGIRIAAVYSSPAYRALQTVRLAALGDAQREEELDLPGGMRADPAAMSAQAAWLRARAAQAPPAGSNVFVVTHAPNMSAAFADQAAGLADGEALVFRPGATGPPELLARVPIEAWPQLADR